MWFDPNDNSRPVISPLEQIELYFNKYGKFELPTTAVLLYLRGIDYIMENYDVEIITEKFPRFLNSCPIYKIKHDNNLCILDGGRGAPQAADTVEILGALGVNNIVSVGLIGGYSEKIKAGDIIIPSLAYSEEGTSMHYYADCTSFVPDVALYNKARIAFENAKSHPIVSTDAVYRQTFNKESIWRSKKAVGVDMETSAIFSVCKYLNIKAVSMLMVSDIHPINEYSENWNWKITNDIRKEFILNSINFARSL